MWRRQMRQHVVTAGQARPQGVGLGLRRGLMKPIRQYLSAQQAQERASVFDFLEVAPENWIQWQGQHAAAFDELTEMLPFVSHGLSLSLGGPDPLRLDFIRQVKTFLDTRRMLIYSEHLSYCTDGGQLYDLMPIPFTCAMVNYVAQRIMQVQDMLQRRIAVENVSYYACQSMEMSELDFFLAVVKQADCDILLDVNNVHVNATNHQYDPIAYIHALPTDRLAYLHIAGHYQENKDFIIDTHGAAVVPAVWNLLDAAYAHHGVMPTLLERDFNYPEFNVLVAELDTVRQAQRTAGRRLNATSDAHDLSQKVHYVDAR